MTAPKPEPDDTPLWRGGEFNSEALDAEIKAIQRRNKRLLHVDDDEVHVGKLLSPEQVQRREAAERYLRKGRA